MRLIRRILELALFILVLLYAMLFLTNNSARASLDLLFFQLPEYKVSAWVLLAFVLGGVVGMIISALALIGLRSEKLLLKRKLGQYEKEVARLKTLAQKN